MYVVVSPKGEHQYAVTAYMNYLNLNLMTQGINV